MAERKLKTVFQTAGHTKALKDGSIKPKTFEFEFEEVPTIVQAFRRMVRGLEFDISEMALTTYICARAHGKRFTALPIPIVRQLHHGAMVYNTSGIRNPKDLEGKRVGVNRGYTVTTGVWARSILQHEYGVDLNKITWVLSGDEHVAEYKAPPNVVPIDKGKKMEDLLISGEIVAAGGVAVDHPDIKTLIPNANEVSFEALRTRGLYPINHMLVVKDELLDAAPELAPDIFNAFAAAKQPYIQHLKSSQSADLSKADQTYKRVMDSIGDPLPYGIAPNRKMLEAIIQYAMEQKIIARPFSVEELFPRNTHALVG